MFRALQLIFSPAGTWEKIVKANRSVWATLFLFVLPLLLLTSCIESYALLHWGYQRGQFAQLTRASQSQAVRFGLTQTALDLVTVFLGAQLLRWIIDAPQNRRNFTRCFTTV